jgi:hypothetical protein
MSDKDVTLTNSDFSLATDITNDLKPETVTFTEDQVKQAVDASQAELMSLVRKELFDLEKRLVKQIEQEGMKRRWLKGLVYENMSHYNLLRRFVVRSHKKA